MIRSFADRETERVWLRKATPKLDPRIHKAANRKLRILDAATSLDSLRVPPGNRLEALKGDRANRLEALKGDRAGQHSIRINKQWRICFVWTEAGPEDLTIEDYH